MDNLPQHIITIAALLAVYGLAILVIPAWLTRRAVRQVIGIFREHRATQARTAETIEELGLQPPKLWERMVRPRDYKPTALKILIKAGVVRTTGDDRLYLSEQKLAEMGLVKEKHGQLSGHRLEPWGGSR